MIKTTDKNNSDTSFDSNSVKSDLVNAVLKHAKFDGFTVESLENGAKDIGLDSSNAHAFFPNPAKDIPAHWTKMLDQQSSEFGKGLDPTMRIRDKISSLVKHRIQLLAPHKVCLKSIFGHMALPHNSTQGLHALYSSADAMWLSIGDTTSVHDRNHYTKRGILATVLLCSFAFYMQDTDDDIDRYIDARIKDALKLGKFKSIKDLKDLAQYLPYINHPLKMRD